MTWLRLQRWLGITPTDDFIVLRYRPGQPRPRVLYVGNRQNAARRLHISRNRGVPPEQLLVIQQNWDEWVRQTERESPSPR